MNWRRFSGRAHAAKADDELRQELESFIEITAEQYVAQGMEPDEARRAARRKLGNPSATRRSLDPRGRARGSGLGARVNHEGTKARRSSVVPRVFASCLRDCQAYLTIYVAAESSWLLVQR